MNAETSARAVGNDISTTSLSVRNRARAEDGFGLLSIGGYLINADVSVGAVEVRFAGNECTLGAEEAVGPLTQDGTRQVEFHLVSHLVPDGDHQVQAAAILADGRRVEFPALHLKIDNGTALGRQVAEDLREFGTAPIVGRIIDSSLFPYEKGTARAWFDADFDDDIPMSLEPAPDAETAQRHLLRWGFCVLHEQLPAQLVEDFKAQLSGAIERGDLKYRAGSSDRIHGAHQKLPSARAVWLYPPVLQFLEDYF